MAASGDGSDGGDTGPLSLCKAAWGYGLSNRRSHLSGVCAKRQTGRGRRGDDNETGGRVLARESLYPGRAFGTDPARAMCSAHSTPKTLPGGHGAGEPDPSTHDADCVYRAHKLLVSTGVRKGA